MGAARSRARLGLVPPVPPRQLPAPRRFRWAAVLWLLGFLVELLIVLLALRTLTGCTAPALVLQREARDLALRAEQLEARSWGADRAAAHGCHSAAVEAEGAAHAGYPHVTPTAAQAAGRMRAACAVLPYLRGAGSSPPASGPDLGGAAAPPDLQATDGGTHVG